MMEKLANMTYKPTFSQWHTTGGGAWVAQAPPRRASPGLLGQAARMHPVVLDNITNNQILKLFVEKNPRILDFSNLLIFFSKPFFPCSNIS